MQALANLMPYAVLALQILFLLSLLAWTFRNSFGKNLSRLLEKYSLQFAFVILLASLLGSLFYSRVIGFEPCVLCIWQRVFLYPQVLIFGWGLYKKDKRVFKYAAILSAIALIIAIYQEISTRTGLSVLECTSAGGACSKVYVKEFGYITIPVMSITVSIWVLFLAWTNRKKDENSNA